MNIYSKTLISASLISILSGCVYVDGKVVDNDNKSWKQEQRDNNNAISQLQLGSTRAEVMALLSSPSFSEAFTQQGEEIRVLFYRTRHRESDGETSRDETTPLVFKNDILIGWGEDYYAALSKTLPSD